MNRYRKSPSVRRGLRTALALGAALAVSAATLGSVPARSGASEPNNDTGKRPKVNYGQGIDEKTITFGTSAPTSGAFSFIGAELVGTMNAFAKHANETGGIAGRQLKIIAYDNPAMDPAKDLANLQRLWERDKVLGIYSFLTDSFVPYLRKNKIPAFTLGMTAAPFAKQNPTVFPLIGNYINFNQDFVYGIMKVFKYKPKTVAIQYDTTLLPAGQYVGDFKKTWKDYGVKVVTTDVVNFTDDCTTKVQKWRSLDVDWVQFMGIGYISCLPAMARIGWKPKIGMDGWGTSLGGLATMMGPVVDGMVTAWEGNRLTDGKPEGMNPQIKEARAAIAKYSPELNTIDHLDSAIVRSTWVAMSMVRAWAQEKGRTDFSPATLVKWLQGRKNYKSGVIPTILSLASGCKQGTGSQSLGRWRWDKVKKVATRDPETKFIGPHNTPFIFKQQKKDPCYVSKRAAQTMGR